MSTDHDRLARLLGTEDLAWLVERVRRRLAQGRPLDGTVTLADATPHQRAAVHRLLGRKPRPGAALTVPLPAVDQVLRRSGVCAGGLAAAVVALTGAVTDRSLAAAQTERAWQQALDPLAAVVAERPELAGWRDRVLATGLLRRLARTPDNAAELVADLVAVVRRLPAEGVPLGRFAAEVTGDAHGLDDDRPLTTLVLGAAQALAGLPIGAEPPDGTGSPDGSELPGGTGPLNGTGPPGGAVLPVGAGPPDGRGAEWRREVLAAVGLLRDDLSTTVLTFGVPGDAATATGRALAGWCAAAQPVVLTLRQLVRDPPRLNLRGQVVSVCENPVVLSAAADRLGDGCQPLVCTSGQPGAAVVHLLRLLVQAGATLRYHGDFDWGGLRIGNVVFGRLPVRPWRFDATAYRTLVRAGLGRELPGEPVIARWDGDLTEQMTHARVRVEEELVLDDLLADLASVPPG